MPNLGATPIARLSIEGLLYGQQVVNVHHYVVTVNDIPVDVDQGLLSGRIS